MIRKTITPPPTDTAAVLRYMGDRAPSAEVRALLADCMHECGDTFVGQVCADEVAVRIDGDTVDFGFAAVQSRSLAAHLAGCDRAVVFAATVGWDIDRYIRRYTRLSPARAYCFQAIGTERIEAVCDAFEAEIAAETPCRPRFSPGYGDLPLAFQRDIFRLLDCPRTVGISLQESLLMTPTKSVTAIIGRRKESAL